MEKASGPLLVTADPGCGKSTLAKFLIDHWLPRSDVICYFFFKSQDQDTVRQALCAILHQLFSQMPLLIKHAMKEYRKNGPKLINSTSSLWAILKSATLNTKEKTVTIVLDALDECVEAGFEDLMRNLESQFQSPFHPERLKYFLTCRPYSQIVSSFYGLLKRFPNIHIPGEEESEIISQEVNRVITFRINRLSQRKQLPTQVKNHLEKKLREPVHRTYLWVYLVFNYLDKTDFKQTIKGCEAAIEKLPTSVNEAYEQILSRTKEDTIVRKVLGIVLASRQPLTISDMNDAISVDYNTRSINDLDLESNDVFKMHLRSWCGLFISVHHERVYLLHQTAREFLVAEPTIHNRTTTLSLQRWHHSFTMKAAHAIIAEACVLHLNLINSNDTKEATRVDGCESSCEGESAAHVSGSSNRTVFSYYAVANWVFHFRNASIIDGNPLIPLTLNIFERKSQSYSLWLRTFWVHEHGGNPPGGLTDLMVAASLNNRPIIKMLLEHGSEVEAKDTKFKRTPISWAAKSGSEKIIEILLENGADIDSTDIYGRTPLLIATSTGHKHVVKLLLKKGANINAKDRGGWTALTTAMGTGHGDIQNLLTTSEYSQNPT
uniref:Uncharacterized protein n=1 Tax=Bionectria ochroleuca TaxID=29856 RepID=A0A0B7KC70_BIOOC